MLGNDGKNLQKYYGQIESLYVFSKTLSFLLQKQSFIYSFLKNIENFLLFFNVKLSISLTIFIFFLIFYFDSLLYMCLK